MLSYLLEYSGLKKTNLVLLKESIPTMTTIDLKSSIDRYNSVGLHYNIIADACYSKLKYVNSPKHKEFLPYIVSALMVFDMQRQMGKNPLDIDKKGSFINRLRDSFNEISDDLIKITDLQLLQINPNSLRKPISKVYSCFNQLHSDSSKSFHVGVTKILHFMNPNLFPIVDSNAAEFWRKKYTGLYKNSTQPGYSSDKYIKVLEYSALLINEIGKDNLQHLEPETPLIRILDKIIFISTKQ